MDCIFLVQFFVKEGARKQYYKEKLTDDAMLPFLGSGHLFGREKQFVERAIGPAVAGAFDDGMQDIRHRSEERRVGKEWRAGWSGKQEKRRGDGEEVGGMSVREG